jgi:hypothetical protein
MREALREARQLPLILRCTLGGSLVLSVAVAIVALVGALNEYPSTAWFAVIEGGFIGAVTGAILGLLAGTAAFLIAAAARRIKHVRYS